MLLLDGGSVPLNQKLAADQVYFNMKVFGLSTVNSTNFLLETIEVASLKIQINQVMKCINKTRNVLILKLSKDLFSIIAFGKVS